MKKEYNGKSYSDVADVIQSSKAWEFYVWGNVVKVHRIGDYAIIEYVIRSGEDEGRHYFHPAVWSDKYKEFHDGQSYWQDTSQSWNTLETAIVGAIAYKFDGANSQACGYFSKMIGLEKDENDKEES